MQSLKEILILLKDNPSGTICTLCVGAVAMIYSDQRDFIAQQQQALSDISKTQATIALELREINTRLSELEHGQKNER